MTHEVYAAVFKCQQDARDAAREFIKNIDQDTMASVTKLSYQNIKITLKDGTEYHFMDEDTYRSWCLGSSYKMLGDPDTLYHSGHKQTELD